MPSLLAPCTPRPAARARTSLRQVCRPVLAGRRLVVARASGEPDASTSAMTLEEAQELLGVNDSDGFDNILSKKTKQVGRANGDQEKVSQVEAAYDLILMASMKKRLTGEMKVSNSVRFADVPIKKTSKQVQPSWTDKIPGGAVTIQRVPDDQLKIQGAVFAALIAWAFIQGATESYDAQQADVAGLQGALGLAAGVYFMREKKRLGLGRSFLYAVGGITLGCIIGNGVESWVRVDIVPLLGMGSPGILVGEFGLIGVLLASVFLA